MAFSAHSDPDQVKEHFSEEEIVERQAAQLAEMIRNAKHFVAFTGAGISTSAGIPDFRGPNGVWTRRAEGKRAPRGTSSLQAVPTVTHMALLALEAAGMLQLLISQNCDGLHRRSGFPPSKLAELHGNSNLERCVKCGKQFLRDFQVRSSSKVHSHETQRRCVCGAQLVDTIVNFGEALPTQPLHDGFENSRKADLFLCLGSSLTVTPAADMPAEAAQCGASLVVCNLQRTPLDKLCKLRIFSRTDHLMQAVCRHLQLQLPRWRLRRSLVVSVADDGSSATLSCSDSDATPATFLARLAAEVDNSKVADFQGADCARRSRFELQLRHLQLPRRLRLRMTFMRHYAEPDLRLLLQLERGGCNAEKRIELLFDPADASWSCSGGGAEIEGNPRLA